MRKFLIFFLAASVSISLIGCDNNKKPPITSADQDDSKTTVIIVSEMTSPLFGKSYNFKPEDKEIIMMAQNSDYYSTKKYSDEEKGIKVEGKNIHASLFRDLMTTYCGLDEDTVLELLNSDSLEYRVSNCTNGKNYRVIGSNSLINKNDLYHMNSN